MEPVTKEPQINGEKAMLGVYIDVEAELLTSEEHSSEDDERRTWRNAEPVSVEKPQVEYEIEVPGPLTIISLISHRRVDRIPLGQAKRPDVCLPCGQDTTTQQGLTLYELPCGHRWCKQCLARAFLFAIQHNAFHRLNCCTDEEIPIKYFKRIVEDRPHPQPEYEPGWEPGSYIDAKIPHKGAQGGQILNGTVSKDGKVPRNPLRVSHCVEKEQKAFINKVDLAFYKLKLEEFETLPKDKLYCYRRACGSFIPMSCRTGTRGTCPRCHRVTCKRCRKGWHTHESKIGKCDAYKDRMEVVKNDRKLMILAKKKGWKRCPSCRMYVDKVRGGCLSVLCRCGRHFFFG